jgi:hypothetical protein
LRGLRRDDQEIYPEMFNARELVVSSFQEQRHGRTVLNVGRVHFGTQYQAARIDRNVALAAIDAFGAVIAPDTADAGGPGGLAIDDPSTRLAGYARCWCGVAHGGRCSSVPRCRPDATAGNSVSGLPAVRTHRGSRRKALPLRTT